MVLVIAEDTVRPVGRGRSAGRSGREGGRDGNYGDAAVDVEIGCRRGRSPARAWTDGDRELTVAARIAQMVARGVRT